jgi:hypothetical protein
MVEEVDTDVSTGQLYFSKRLTPRGVSAWPTILRQAAQQHDALWLARELKSGSLIGRTEYRHGRPVAVPHTAAQTLADGQFNTYYIRGLCRRALAEQVLWLVVYRAKQVEQPRWESERRIGARLEPQALLNDLRTNRDVEPALGVPAGPNSGLSVRLPTDEELAQSGVA